MPRGRPPIHRPKHDHGTPELQAKRAAKLTAETVDQLLDCDIISQEQHWCAVHFRWLYTLRYGAPTPYITQLLELRPMNTEDDPEWRAAREAEYHEAASILHKCGVLDDVMEVLLYNPVMTLRQCTAIVPAVREGLDILQNLWCNKTSCGKQRYAYDETDTHAPA